MPCHPQQTKVSEKGKRGRRLKVWRQGPNLKSSHLSWSSDPALQTKRRLRNVANKGRTAQKTVRPSRRPTIGDKLLKEKR